MNPPRLRLLGAPALLGAHGLSFLPERRFRLAVVLALSPQGATRDELAALFWPERPQRAARSNLRKLILELRGLKLPGMALDGDRLHWSIDSDARDLLEGRAMAGPWTEPLLGLGGHDSAAFDDWLLVQRTRLCDAWAAQQRRAADAAAAPGHPHLRAPPVAVGTVSWPDDEPDFVGRGDALAGVARQLNDERCRLLTLTGPGGVGKSALALALMRRAGHMGLRQLHWIALEDLTAAAQLPTRLARELGVPLGGTGNGWDEVVAALAGRRLTLVLDNAEHLPELPGLMDRLLAAVPGVQLLVTSRRRMGLDAERTWPVPPLDDASARGLFVAAAQRAPARQALQVSDPMLGELMDLLGRLPLAIRLAAAWTRYLPLATLLQQLQASLDLLQVRDALDEQPSHRSLRATFDGSWALLPPGLRPALASLAVVTGSMRLDVAQAVAGAGAAQLAALADASLVELEPSGRVRLHPMVRRFAREQLASDEVAAALARHAQALADVLRPYVDFDDIDVAQALAVLSPERQQVEQAWATAVAQRRPDWLAALAAPLGNLVQSQGGLEVVLSLFAQGQQVAASAAPAAPAALCAVALEHAALHFWRGDDGACERAARVALPAARAARLGRVQRQVLNTLALVEMRRGRPERAAALMGRALAQARAAASTREVAIFAGNLSGVRRELGEYEAARTIAEEALQAHRAQGSAIGETSMLNELAHVAHVQGRLDDAYAFSRQSLEVTERHAMALRRPTMLTHQASIRMDQGRLDEADALAARSLADLNPGATPHYHEPTLRRLLAELALRRGHAAAARVQLRRACACVPVLSGTAGARGLLWSLAVLAAFEGRQGLAAALADRAERGRPPQARPLPRYAVLRAGLPRATGAPPADPLLQAEVERLLADPPAAKSTHER